MRVEIWNKVNGMVHTLSWVENGKRYEVPLYIPRDEDEELKEIMVDLSDYVYLREKLSRYLALDSIKEVRSITKDKTVKYEVYGSVRYLRRDIINDILTSFSGKVIRSADVASLIAKHYPNASMTTCKQFASIYLKYMLDNKMIKLIKHGKYSIPYDPDQVYDQINKMMSENMNIERDLL